MLLFDLEFYDEYSCDRLKSLTVTSPITINTQERVKRTAQSKKIKMRRRWVLERLVGENLMGGNPIFPFVGLNG